MCLLFSDGLTVTDSIPLCSLPMHSPQESEFQETASDRSDCRETVDGGLSGMENNTSFLLFPFCCLLHFQPQLLGTDFENGKSSGSSCHLLLEKQLWFLCREQQRNNFACEEISEVTQLFSQCVNASLRKNFCSIACMVETDEGDFSLSIRSKQWSRWEDTRYVHVCVFPHLARTSGWRLLSAGGYLGDESWGKVSVGEGGYKWVKGWSWVAD